MDAEDAVRLLERLSEDLQHKLGSGFSERNLWNATIPPGSQIIAGAGNIELESTCWVVTCIRDNRPQTRTMPSSEM